MSSQRETDALIELLIQLQKIAGTVPDQAKALLTEQPPLAYSLIKLMVRMNILSAEALQKSLTVAAYQGQQPVLPVPAPAPAPVPAVINAPPPLPSNGPPPPLGAFQQYPPGTVYPSAPPVNPAVPHSYLPPPPGPVASQLSPSAQAMLAAIPDDQRSMVLQILSYTPEQVNQLSPSEKATFIQLRATFGISS